MSELRPGLPSSATPPQQLADKIRHISHPEVVGIGLTTTRKGEWAALVKVSKNALPPITDVERLLTGFPIVYETVPDNPPVARPAYPTSGE
jgi:hypothetical protein